MAPKDELSIEFKRSRQARKKYYEFVTSHWQSIYPTTTNPVELRSLEIWGIEGMKVPETKTKHYLSIRRTVCCRRFC